MCSCPAEIFVALVVLAFIGGNLPTLVATIGILYAPQFARVAWGVARGIRARACAGGALARGGAGLDHLARGAAQHAFHHRGAGLFTFSFAMLLEAGLSFLGLGVRPPVPSWGQMVGSLKDYLYTNPWPVLVPALALFFTVLAVNVLGDWLQDALNPAAAMSHHADALHRAQPGRQLRWSRRPRARGAGRGPERAARRVCALVGESGSGKSVTGFSLMGLIDPPGRVSAMSCASTARPVARDGTRARRAAGRDISMVFQEPMTALNPGRTVGAQIAEVFLIHERISRRQAWDRAVDLMERVGIREPAQRARLSA